jgi:hypothetical protein
MNTDTPRRAVIRRHGREHPPTALAQQRPIARSQITVAAKVYGTVKWEHRQWEKHSVKSTSFAVETLMKERITPAIANVAGRADRAARPIASSAAVEQIAENATHCRSD